MWHAIAYVTSGTSLVAFICATIAWILKRKTDQTENIIKTAPEAQRGELVGKWLEFFDIDTKSLPAAEQTKLALLQIRSRAERFRISAGVIVVVAIILAVVAIIALLQKSDTGNAHDANQAYDYHIQQTALLFDLTTRVPNFFADGKTSIVCEDRYDIVLKTKASAPDFFIRDGTTGTALRGECISHPLGTTYEEIAAALGLLNNVNHLYKLILQKSRFPINEPVRVQSRWIYTGSLKNETNEFVGYRVQYPTALVTFAVRLPPYKPCKDVALYVLDGAKAPTKVEGVEPYRSQDGQVITYSIQNPQVTAGYLIAFDW